MNARVEIDARLRAGLDLLSSGRGEEALATPAGTGSRSRYRQIDGGPASIRSRDTPPKS